MVSLKKWNKGKLPTNFITRADKFRATITFSQDNILVFSKVYHDYSWMIKLRVRQMPWLVCLKGIFMVYFFFSIYINDPPDDLSSNPELFGDNTSLFSVVRDINVTARDPNDNLQKIRTWNYQWKMSFKPDLLQKAQEVIMFSRKGTKICHPLLLFTNNPVQESPSKNILILDSKLNFEEHLRTVSIKAN